MNTTVLKDFFAVTFNKYYNYTIRLWLDCIGSSFIVFKSSSTKLITFDIYVLFFVRILPIFSVFSFFVVTELYEFECSYIYSMKFIRYIKDITSSLIETEILRIILLICWFLRHFFIDVLWIYRIILVFLF